MRRNMGFSSRECAMTCSPVAALAFPTADVDLDTFFDVSLDLLVVRELDGRVVKASASWFTMLGY